MSSRPKRHHRGNLARPAVAAALAALCVACTTAPPAPTTLFDRLGGQPGIDRVVNALLDRTSTDPRTRRTFEGVRLPYLKESVARHFCVVTDGPDCHYEGETMARAHGDLGLRGSDFDVMVGFLREELDRAGVDAASKNELLKRLAPIRREVVTAGVMR